MYVHEAVAQTIYTLNQFSPSAHFETHPVLFLVCKMCISRWATIASVLLVFTRRLFCFVMLAVDLVKVFVDEVALTGNHVPHVVNPFVGLAFCLHIACQFALVFEHLDVVEGRALAIGA